MAVPVRVRSSRTALVRLYQFGDRFRPERFRFANLSLFSDQPTLCIYCSLDTAMCAVEREARARN